MTTSPTPQPSWALSAPAESIGLSLGEIHEILAVRDRGELPCAHVAALIDRHAAELAGRIAALEAMRRDL